MLPNKSTYAIPAEEGADTSDLIKQIANRLMLMCPVAGKTEFVLGGSAALMVYGLSTRDSLNDIDVLTDIPKKLIDLGIKDPLDVDITNSGYFWGQINIGDANKSPVIYEENHIKLRALSPETMFIHKTDCAREKDLEDVAHLARFLNPKEILLRMAELKQYNAYDTWYLSAENLLAEIQCQYNQPITLEMIDLLQLESQDAYVLNRTFGLLSTQHQKQVKTGARL